MVKFGPSVFYLLGPHVFIYSVLRIRSNGPHPFWLIAITSSEEVLGVAVEDGEDVTAAAAAVVEGEDVMRAFFTADILRGYITWPMCNKPRHILFHKILQNLKKETILVNLNSRDHS